MTYTEAKTQAGLGKCIALPSWKNLAQWVYSTKPSIVDRNREAWQFIPVDAQKRMVAQTGKPQFEVLPALMLFNPSNTWKIATYIPTQEELDATDWIIL